ncbi:MAG TPA: isoprenylcysteine carboxylmethyltransferase family protein [Gemmatimonadales bacterium]
MIALRHLVAVAVLPFTVAVLVPLWLARRAGLAPGWATTAPGMAAQALGLILLAVGLTLFVASLRRFATEGRGTLAPWDPPRELVVRGPYRYVRNPMISGVLLFLLGEALVLRSPPHLTWALTFFAVNALYIPVLEEPGLEARFGGTYRAYCRRVPRLIPRLKPWKGAESS